MVNICRRKVFKRVKIPVLDVEGQTSFGITFPTHSYPNGREDDWYNPGMVVWDHSDTIKTFYTNNNGWQHFTNITGGHVNTDINREPPPAGSYSRFVGGIVSVQTTIPTARMKSLYSINTSVMPGSLYEGPIEVGKWDGTGNPAALQEPIVDFANSLKYGEGFHPIRPSRPNFRFSRGFPNKVWDVSYPVLDPFDQDDYGSASWYPHCMKEWAPNFRYTFSSDLWASTEDDDEMVQPASWYDSWILPDYENREREFGDPIYAPYPWARIPDIPGPTKVGGKIYPFFMGNVKYGGDGTYPTKYILITIEMWYDCYQPNDYQSNVQAYPKFGLIQDRATLRTLRSMPTIRTSIEYSHYNLDTMNSYVFANKALNREQAVNCFPSELRRFM